MQNRSTLISPACRMQALVQDKATDMDTNGLAKLREEGERRSDTWVLSCCTDSSRAGAAALGTQCCQPEFAPGKGAPRTQTTVREIREMS